MIFKDIIFEFFGYWKNIDSNKDVDGKGTMERYNEIIGIDIDDEILPLVDNLVPYNTLPRAVLERLLIYLEKNVGSDLYLGSGIEMRRRVRQNIHDYYRIRGTLGAYHLMFGMLGYTITITETWTDYSFDSPLTFDDPVRRFDMNCSNCSSYRIDVLGDYWDEVEEVSTIPDEDIEAFRSIIIFNQPINAVLSGMFINNGADYQILSYNNSYS